MERPSINFYGPDVDFLVTGNIKLLTLRLEQEKYNIPPGTHIDGVFVDKNTSVPLVVIANETKTLLPAKMHSSVFTAPEILLDGYLDPKVAAKDLRTYPGYDRVTGRTPLQGISFVTERLFQTFNQAKRHDLVHMPLADSMKDPRFRRLYFPSLFQWKVWEGANFRMWKEYIIEHGLITEKEVYDVLRSNESVARLAEHQLYTPERMQSVIEEKGLMYNAVVLWQNQSDA